jgi:hemoglobin
MLKQGQTLFQRIGGKEAVNATVDKFYLKVLADDRVKHFFDGVDMKKQTQHQKVFLTYAFGGLPNYPGKSMRSAHQKMVDDKGLTDVHYENLGLTLTELGVSNDLIAEVVVIGESTRNDILCK